MYIDPYLAGVLSTIGIEAIATVILLIYIGIRGGKR